MKFLVCVKQVPVSGNVRVDEETGVLLRSSADTKLNPYDLFALETALRLKTEEDTVTVLTMGPPAAKEALLECLAMGADSAVLVTDRAFAGSDVFATAYTLSQAARRLEPQLILCGRQTTDGDTAQVGAELSEFLSIPCAANVCAVLRREENGLRVLSNLGEFEQELFLRFPCLIAVEKDIFTPRLPSFKRQRAMKNPGIITLTLADFEDQNTSHYGLSGSPTQVERTFAPVRDVKTMRLREENAAEGIYAILAESKFI
ncbi:MAG: electron transfer flavoprotein subunit beta/FixA family protein [Clostridiaceae bacterium]